MLVFLWAFSLTFFSLPPPTPSSLLFYLNTNLNQFGNHFEPSKGTPDCNGKRINTGGKEICSHSNFGLSYLPESVSPQTSASGISGDLIHLLP